MVDNYPKAYKEVIEILKYVPKEDMNKIPIEIIDMFNEKKDKDYEYKIDKNKEFKQQEILQETKVILANIYIKYWATAKEKEQINEIYRDARRKSEEEKIKKYGTEVIFAKKEDKNQIKEDDELKEIVIFNEIKWYDKFLAFFKKIFNIKR